MNILVRRVAAFAVVFSGGLVSVSSDRAHGGFPIIDTSGTTSESIPARRNTFVPPALTGPIDHVAVLGDSLFFEDIPPIVRVNTVIPAIRTTLQSELNDPSIRVQNLSRPGLAIKYPVRSGPFQFISLSEWIPMIFDDPADYPDLVVIAATGIDLNLKYDVPLDQIVPKLVAELERIVEQLRRLGMQVVVVPAFGVNDAMYDALLSFSTGTTIRRNTNTRVNALNTALSISDLPMLFAGYRGLDLDFDGDVDETNFVGFGAGRYPDDGIHTNADGEHIIARHVSTTLVKLIRATR
jgi:lysophospholipase L1-like esterase